MEDNHIESKYPKHSRFFEIRELVGYILSGESCQLIGMPGVGREDVFGLLCFNKEVRKLHFGESFERYHFVFINFAEVSNRPFHDVIKLFMYSLESSLKERGFDGASRYLQGIIDKTMSVEDDMIMVQAIKDVVKFLVFDKNLSLVFLLNRFDYYAHTVTGEFFVLLEALHEIAENKFSSVFALTRPINELIDDEILKREGSIVIGNEVFLSVHDEPSIMFQSRQLSEKFNQEPPLYIYDEVFYQTGGHRRLTKRAMEEVLRTGFIEKENIAPLLTDSRSVRSVLYDIWLSLTPQEQMLLKRQAASIGEEIWSGPVEHDKVIFLHKLNILISNRFTIKLFEGFVRYRAENAMEEKLSVKPHTDEILKGDQVITGTFTKLEHRLLMLLIQNQNEVVDRETVIKNVWPDSKNIEGITDQAIDQLVFRLRKKIEKDPANPELLQTVKGRGFLFV